ncbi:TonB-dependent receptor domain-containing protein [Parachitinimonas caeni]|uniref:TonB-dependent receptor n=1 Tax=Parachitinimonas caeni TaxID=3031301 RepID=A0ABT7DYL0_9NEIS|nr:TonB-dependent receptor [Parachitinimonas caeni]MDK2125150.1 TonB-dependent receptor [Parachitinimonas caeni]
MSHRPNPNRSRLLPLPVTLAVALALSAVAQAEVVKETEQLDPVLVSAKRGKDTNTVVRSSRIDVEQATSLRDIFKQTPEVNVAGGLGVAQKLYVRGIGERMLAVTIDGAAQPESAYHHTGQVMIEPELLKRVEIEAGTGAATAGPGALAGALRLTTKSADDLLAPGQKVGALVKAGYQDASAGTKGSATVFGRLGEQFGIVASLTKLDTENYRDGNGDDVANSATEANSAFVKFNGKFDAHQFALAHEKHDDEGLRNKRTNLLPSPFNPTERQRTERTSTTFNYGYDAGNDLIKLHLTAYDNENSVRLAMGKKNEEKDGTRSHGFTLGNVSQLANHKLSYGLDYRRDTGYANVPGKSIKDETAGVTGLYLQDDMALTEQWSIGLGVRYDRFTYTDAKDQTFDSNGFSPSASVAFAPIEGLTMRLTHARALRGVGIVEPFLKAFQDNDRQIDPEKARNTELAVQWQSGAWRANGSVFRQNIDHYIGYDDFRDNMGNVTVDGYNASVGFLQGPWSASLGVSYARPKLNDQPLADSDALLLGNATGRIWVNQLDYHLSAWHLKLGWTGRYVEKLTHVPQGVGSKPGYQVHDVYARWLPTGKDNLNLTLTVKNLFDRQFYDQGSFGYHPRWGKVAGLPEPGRDVRVSVAYKF